jgi:hypothetical protein
VAAVGIKPDRRHHAAETYRGLVGNASQGCGRHVEACAIADGEFESDPIEQVGPLGRGRRSWRASSEDVKHRGHGEGSRILTVSSHPVIFGLEQLSSWCPVASRPEYRRYVAWPETLRRAH